MKIYRNLKIVSFCFGNWIALQTSASIDFIVLRQCLFLKEFQQGYRKKYSL